VSKLLSRYSQKISNTKSDIQALLKVSLEKNSTTLDDLLTANTAEPVECSPDPSDIFSDETTDENKDVKSPEDPAEHAARVMIKKFHKAIRLRFAGDTLILQTMVVLMLSSDPKVDLPALIPGIQSIFEAGAPRRLAVTRDRILGARADIRDLDQAETWLALAYVVSSWAQSDSPCSGFDDAIDSLCKLAERSSDSKRPWSLRQALAAYILSMHPSPQTVWNTAFDLGRMRLKFRTTLSKRASPPDGPVLSSDLLKKIIKHLE
jgi:hypothetical protein